MLKKVQYIGLVLLAILVFTVTIPAASSSTSGGSDSSTFKYYPTFSTLNYTTYSGSGFLYNTVAELQKAYDLNPLYAHGYNGAGQTVVIVDAFGSPTIYQDLLSFIQWQDAHGANLPWTTMAEVMKHLQIYYPLGKPVFDPSNGDQVGWSTEVTLDVDMVHAIAPGANIALVIAPSDDDIPLQAAVNFAVYKHLGCAISQSWGSPECLLGPSDLSYIKQADSVYKLAAIEGITVFASAGDWGASDFGTYNNPLFPSSDPYVTAVGGTNLFMVCNNSYREGSGHWGSQGNGIGVKYNYEIAGNDYEAMIADKYPAPSDIVTTGGAMSSLFPLPWWQKGITLTYTDGTKAIPTGRCTSDVSFDSGVYGGLGAVPWSAATPGHPIYYIVGGTSAGSPFWAALTAITCQYAGHSLGDINPWLYSSRCILYLTGAFHDIKLGDNTYPTGNTVLGYKATPGWDAPTGIGSPDAAKLVPLMRLW